MDFMKHKAALAVEVRFLRRMSLALTASVYDRNGSYTDYPTPGDASVSQVRDYEPYFLLDGRLSWEKASAGSMSMPRTSPIPVTAIWAASACPAHGSRAAWC